MAEPPPRGRVDLAKDLGLTVASLDALGERLNADFRGETWGFAQFADVGDRRLQSIISDQVLAASEAILTNLLETRVAEMDYGEATAGGARYGVGIDLEDVREDSQIVEFYRAFGSTLDCLAGVSVGVLRIPRSVVKASMRRDLFDLDPSKTSDPATANAWGLFRRRLDELRGGPPDRWMDRALLYRDAAVHRPRQLNMQLQRPSMTPLLLPPSAAHLTWRFDTHLRRKPWLPDLEHLAADEPIERLYLHEPAATTMRGLIERLNEAVETLARELLEVWESVGSGKLRLAVPNWSLPDELDVNFEGFAPDQKATGDIIRGHPQTAIRLGLAEQLRQHEHGTV
jgi:hypothetical protein